MQPDAGHRPLQPRLYALEIHLKLRICTLLEPHKPLQESWKFTTSRLWLSSQGSTEVLVAHARQQQLEAELGSH